MNDSTERFETLVFDSSVMEFDTILLKLNDAQKSLLFVKLLSKMNSTPSQAATSYTLNIGTVPLHFFA